MYYSLMFMESLKIKSSDMTGSSAQLMSSPLTHF